MPAIQKGEKRSDYIPRCINYVMKYEGLTEKESAGKCEGIFDQHEKNHKSKADQLISSLGEWLNKRKEKENAKKPITSAK